MLMGVLRMPLPDEPGELGIVEWLQIKSRMREAANEIEALLVEVQSYREEMAIQPQSAIDFTTRQR